MYGNPPAFHLIVPGDGQATLTEQGPVGNNASWTVTFQNGEQRVFNVSPPFFDKYGYYQNNSGPLSSIIDRNGNTTLVGYDSNNRLLAVSNPARRQLFFTYANNSPYVTSVTSDSGSGINLTYTYAPSLLGYPVLAQVTQADNTFVTFTYDAWLNITSVNDTNGRVLESHTYDFANRGLSS